MEYKIKIRALEAALDYVLKRLHEFRHGEQSVAELKKVLCQAVTLKCSRDYFREGDTVKILKDYNTLKAGDIVKVECCGDELGGIDNIELCD